MHFIKLLFTMFIFSVLSCYINSVSTATKIKYTDISEDASLLIIDSHHCGENKPKLQDLLTYSNKISSKWQEIGLHLGISKYHLSVINIDNLCVQDKCNKMLSTWLEITISPCWCKFVQALNKCSLYTVAKEAKSKLQKLSNNQQDTSDICIKEELQKRHSEKPFEPVGCILSPDIMKRPISTDHIEKVAGLTLPTITDPVEKVADLVIPISIDQIGKVADLEIDTVTHPIKKLDDLQLTMYDMIQLAADFEGTCPLANSKVMLHTFDHNGGILICKDGGIKITIPSGAIRTQDLVMFAIATGLYGPFELPLKCHAATDLVSPYYWVRVTGSYRFLKPIQVEFEHFAALTATCDSSHYQLLTCKDDASHAMQPVDCDLSFKIRDDNISLCSFETKHFCSYCLSRRGEHQVINRIGAYYLIPQRFKNAYTVEIWFHFPISDCSKRSREIYYEKKGMILQPNAGSYIFEASCDTNSASYFALKYDDRINGWDIDHSLSNEILTKKVNFYNYYKEDDLRASEEDLSFPPRFVINVKRKTDCATDLNTNLKVVLYNDKDKPEVESIFFKLYIPLSALPMLESTSQPVAVEKGSTNETSFPLIQHNCQANKPELKELIRYSDKISNYWKEIALCLGISVHKVSSIDGEERIFKDKCLKIFNTWLQVATSPCWCHLIKALREDNIKLYDVAREIIDKNLKHDNPSTCTSIANTSRLKDNLQQLTLFLQDVPESHLVYFIIKLFSKDSAREIIKDIRCNSRSKKDNIEKICVAYLKGENPSWTEVYRALKDANCDEAAENIELSFL